MALGVAVEGRKIRLGLIQMGTYKMSGFLEKCLRICWSKS